MRVICLEQPPNQYSCRPYLILGDWSTVEDVNTVIDPGPDGHIITQIEKTYTGVGKKPVDLIVLTHNHFDHAAGAMALKERFGAKIVASLPGPGVDRCLTNGESLRFGDCWFEVIHVPVHSEDSICLYCQSEGVIFSGDTSLRVMTSEGSYSQIYLAFLERLYRLPLNQVYSGHDPPVKENIKPMLGQSIQLVRQSISAREAD